MILMESKYQGKLAICSAPLHTDRSWYSDWARHYLAGGAELIIMHAPKVNMHGQAALRSSLMTAHMKQHAGAACR